MRGKFSKFLALLLAVVMCLGMVTTAYAFPSSARGSSVSSGWGSSISSLVSSWWSSLWSSSSDDSQSEDSSTEDTGSDATMTAVEDETTVDNSSALRATTYALTTASNDGTSTTADESDTTLKYFSVTMYDYDSDTINAAMHQAEVDEALAGNGISSLTQWNGLYFSYGDPTSTRYVNVGSSYTYTYDLDEEVTAWVPVSLDDIDSSSTYVLVAYYGQALTGATTGITGTPTEATAGSNIDQSNDAMNSATAWTITANTNGTYTISCSAGCLTIGSGTSNTKTQSSSVSLNITENSNGYVYISRDVTTQSQGGNTTTTYYLNQYGGESDNYKDYGGWTEANAGSRFYIYKLDTVSTGTTSTGSLGFAGYNYYTGNSAVTGTGNYLYSAIASSTLDSSGNIVFNDADNVASMLFDSDSSVKTIYTNVEMPFVYNSKTSTYTFDSSQYGVYFMANDDQGSTTAQSNGRLYWTETTQKLDDDMKTTVETVWAPYDATENVGSGQNGSSYDTMNYHFGLKATIPFTMTTSGKLNDADSESDDIVFSFSGDDDVWVYIDGTEVIDLGGIKNRLSATINFATNTVTVTAADNGYSSAGSTGDSNEDTTTNLVANGWTYSGDGQTATYTHALFNDDDCTGLINMTRETFAASSSHELSVFYLERGAGSSNCKIEFNLPVYDYVSVTKNITQSITSDGTITDLTDEEQAVIDNVSFGFTLYHDGEAVSGATYSILNVDGQAVGTGTTDSSGHFTLQNGQTARFVTQFDSDDTWYVVEDEKTGYSTSPDWSYTSTGANDATVTTKNSGLTSDIVKIEGGDESEDSIHFTCNNYLSVTIPNPGILTEDEEIVIDYGLSVEIDVLSNDLYRADEVEVYGIEVYESSKSYAGGSGNDNSENASTSGETTVTGTYGTATLNSDGIITYQLTSQMTGVEVLVYEVKLTGTETNEETSKETSKTVYGTGIVYIIPATIMYYEEDFGLVTFKTSTTYSGDGWTVVGTAENDPQEPGVVGTLDDSTYGSDVAYLNDGEDSNGTSMYVNTTGGAAQFSYTFTGTGTTFFARTTNNSATIKVTVTDSDGNTVYQLVRDTSYKNWNTYIGASTSTNYDALYNIPVFTWTASDYGFDYGTYTVTVTVYKGTADNGYGTDFWLDGIRITNPLNESDTYASVANSAYATDGESGMTYVTLREKLLTEYTSVSDDNTLTWTDGNSFVVFTDTDGTVETADTYQSDGPKEEVYLAKGQSVTFSLANWDADSYDLYLGMKAPTGSGTVTIGSTSVSVNNATDCYYEISNYGTISTASDGTKVVTFTITATSDAIISLTNLKVTGNAYFVIAGTTEQTVNVSGYEYEAD